MVTYSLDEYVILTKKRVKNEKEELRMRMAHHREDLPTKTLRHI